MHNTYRLTKIFNEFQPVRDFSDALAYLCRFTEDKIEATKFLQAVTTYLIFVYSQDYNPGVLKTQ